MLKYAKIGVLKEKHAKSTYFGHKTAESRGRDPENSTFWGSESWDTLILNEKCAGVPEIVRIQQGTTCGRQKWGHFNAENS